MRLFLDQMIDTSVAEELRNEEYDILCASEAGMAHANDLEILKYCIQKKRILNPRRGEFLFLSLFLSLLAKNHSPIFPYLSGLLYYFYPNTPLF